MSGTKRHGPSDSVSQRPCDEPEPGELLAIGAVGDRHDQPSALDELPGERDGQAGCGSSDCDGVERRPFRNPERAVAFDDLHFVVEPAQALRGRMRQRRHTLDAHHVSAARRHHRCLVSGPGSDIERAIAGVQLERLDDGRNHERLADGLPGRIDRQRPIGVGALAVNLEHELLAGHARHGMEHGRRADSVLDQRRHHAIAVRCRG